MATFRTTSLHFNSRSHIAVSYTHLDVYKRQEHAGEKTHLEEGNLFAGCCFLIAEDNEINAEILCELLWMYGAKTVVKTDGAQAVQAFRDEAPGTYDAILMDIQMPEMNGYEATRTVRKMDRPDAKEIPIIAMTANAFSEDVQAVSYTHLPKHFPVLPEHWDGVYANGLHNHICSLSI